MWIDRTKVAERPRGSLALSREIRCLELTGCFGSGAVDHTIPPADRLELALSAMTSRSLEATRFLQSDRSGHSTHIYPRRFGRSAQGDSRRSRDSRGLSDVADARVVQG
jgi:hypothetical protein